MYFSGVGGEVGEQTEESHQEAHVQIHPHLLDQDLQEPVWGEGSEVSEWFV